MNKNSNVGQRSFQLLHKLNNDGSKPKKARKATGKGRLVKSLSLSQNLQKMGAEAVNEERLKILMSNKLDTAMKAALLKKIKEDQLSASVNGPPKIGPQMPK